MSDRDRLAAIVKERLDASGVADRRWRTSMSGSIANALITAGVTMPAPDAKSSPPVCGATEVIDGIEYVCERDAHEPGTGHAYTDSVGVVTWGGDQ